MGMKSNVASPQRRFSSLRRRSLQGSSTSDAVSVNGSPGVGTPPGTRSASVKFAINADTAQQSTQPKVVYNNTTIYTPIPSVGSGRGTETAQVHFAVEVKLLNDEQEALLIDVNATAFGQWLFDEVISRLGGLLESDYFGLRYLDKNKQRQWLDLSKTVYKQLKNVIPRSLNFRVKHYPAKPLKELKQEKSRYYLYLQLRRDLHSGRLVGRNNDMHVLAAHILQAEIGDIDKLEDYLGANGSLADLKMFENMTPRVEDKIRELYKTLRGLSVTEAEGKFLERASELETYGVEPVFVQDRKGNHFYVGLSHEGVTAFRGNRKAHVFSWSKIHRISYDGKLFIIQVEWEQRRHTLGFKCQTTEAAEALWKWAVDRQCFFTLNKSTDAKASKASGRLFRKRQSHSFTGRCQKEMLQMATSMPNIPQPSVSRSRSLLNIAKSVSASRQTKSHEQLNRSLEGSTNHLANGNTTPPRSASIDVLSGCVRLAGVASESAEQLNRRPSEAANHSNHVKMYHSNEVIATTASLPTPTPPTTTTTNSNGDLSPAVGMAWSPMPLRKADTLDEVASKEVEAVLTHAEIMRLVAHRQIEDSEPEEGVNANNEMEKLGKKNAASLLSALEEKGRKMDEKEAKNKAEEEEKEEKEETMVDVTTPPLPSATASSPCKLDRQGSLDCSSQNHSSSTSESFATQVHRPEASTMVLERADTVPSDSTPLSSSSTPPSPRPEVNLATHSAVVDPPLDFADAPSLQKDIYFPYLSKVRNLDQDGCDQEALYQPLRFDKPTRDPFALPSRLQELRISVDPPVYSFASSPAKSSVAEPPRLPAESVVKAPLCVDKSPLLLRHGYTLYRGCEFDHLQSHLDGDVGAAENNEVGPRPTVVRAGCAPPVEEPIIVAEYYVPLCDDEEEEEEEEEDEEDEDEDGNEAKLNDVAGPKKVAVTPFNWSAASARIDKILPAKIQDPPRLPPMTTVILSQEIVTPRMDAIDTHHKEVDRLPQVSAESASEALVRSLPKQATKNVSPMSTGGWETTKLEPSLQRTLIQVSKTEALGERQPGQEQTLPSSRPSGSASTITERPVSSAVVQVFWFLLVFLFVHHILKLLRVGPILGFFGATGPEAVGYWNAMEAMVNFFLFRLF
ncbi:FERM domain-containing protein 5 [Taenia crassiceps]|uniref:FERM domain-containing protein 5 n=1 Tax=Taenia crassiceps TaxID=6207 RepID=A0ABR4Q386_9CEST